jgi:hypothetical protein
MYVRLPFPGSIQYMSMARGKWAWSGIQPKSSASPLATHRLGVLREERRRGKRVKAAAAAAAVSSKTRVLSEHLE